MDDNRNPVQDAREMIGEFCREVAVLVLVFVPLEKIVNKGGFGVWWAVGTLVVSAVFLFGRHHTRMEQTISQYVPFAIMIFYALLLLLVAKPLDNWRESRIARKTKVVKQGELFDARKKKVDEERPLIPSPR